MKTIDPYKDSITFGKYNGLIYDDIAEIDPHYIIWLKENVKTVKLPKDYTDAIEWDIMDVEDVYLDAWGEWMSRYG
jgi:hypothetical protein